MWPSLQPSPRRTRSKRSIYFTSRRTAADPRQPGTYNLTSLLAYSAVGANGLETVPLPGDVTEEQIVRILGDVAIVAFKDKTPLSARLLPSPGRHAGEKSDFTVNYLINTTLQPIPGTTR